MQGILQTHAHQNTAGTRAFRAKSSTLPSVRASAASVSHQSQPGQDRPSQSAQFANQLEALKQMSKISADTGILSEVQKFKPIDCTTNPSLVLKAAQTPEFSPLLLKYAKQRLNTTSTRPFATVADQLAVDLGAHLLDIVPGRVSTEVDASLAYDSRATYDKALYLMDLYSKKGVDPKRVYIKLASSWEGIEACRKLQQQGIDCNMTLLFSFAQAAACADAGAALISPFVGRILDWYKAKHGRNFEAHEDPGVISVKRIYTYYKTQAYPTIVMAASFRSADEIRQLAGCDNITISPQLLSELEASTDPLPRQLSPTMRDDSSKLAINKSVFETLHGQDQMAVDKLAEGIRGFEADQMKLEALLEKVYLESVGGGRREE